MSTLTALPGDLGPQATVARSVRMLIARDHITQGKLAADLGMVASALSKRMAGAVPFTLDELAAIADYFGVSVGSLFGESTAPRPGGPDGGVSRTPQYEETASPTTARLYVLPTAA